MTFRLGEYVRERFGGDVIALANEEAQNEFESAVSDFQAGRSSVAAMRQILFGLGVPAQQIRRVLAGERLVTMA